MSSKEQSLRKKVLQATREYYDAILTSKDEPFAPGDRIAYAGRVYDHVEVLSLVDSSLDFWLTTGRFAKQFESNFSHFLNVKHTSLVNSGSSANLVALMTLTSPLLDTRRIHPGDEIITVAAGFPTTLTPIIQYGAIPVFIDVVLPTYNIDCDQLERAVSNKTKAVMLAHTLGNPFDLQRIKNFCDKYKLWLIEDNCDALGSRYQFNNEWKYTGSIGDIGTSSFYPPHHITMGEGGAVYTNHTKLKKILESYRDWGRDCWCESGRDNTCGKRFGHQLGELPMGYDHKYVYSHFGYNLKATDMQAAVGCAQLEKLPHFISARKENWTQLHAGLQHLQQYFVLPEATKNSDPSWFGFIITLQPGCGFSRKEIVAHLESKGIQTRMLFAGNMIKQPCFDEMRAAKEKYRVVGDLTNTDRIMTDSFWVGVYPGMKPGMIEHILETFDQFCHSAKSIK